MSTPNPGDATARAGEEVVAKVPLGDAAGDNRRLAEALEAIASRLEKDAPAKGGYLLVEWLGRCKDPFA